METPSSPDKIEYNFVKYSNCLVLAQRQAIDSLKLPQRKHLELRSQFQLLSDLMTSVT